MSFPDNERLDELMRRAGLSGLTRAQLAAALFAVCACVAFAAWRFWPRTAEDAFQAAPGPAVEAAAPGAPAPAAGGAVEGSATVVVHVVGAVARPGVYPLPAGSRVCDALTAAGGGLGSAAPEALNLARLVGDGEQIAVPTRDEWQALKESGGVGGAGVTAGGASGSASASGAGAAGGSGGKVNLNTADEAALDTLPGVGPSTAKRIVEDRAANGPFGAPEDLLRVSGIGAKKFESLKDLVTVR